MEEEKKEKDDFFDQVLEHYNSVNETLEKVNDDIFDRILDTTKQHREFLKHLITIFFVVISIAVTLSTSKYFYIKAYLIIGITLYIFNIFFSLSHLRETLDGESVLFSRLDFKYKKISFKQRGVAEKYLLLGHINKAQFLSYLKEIQGTEEIKEVITEYKKLPENIESQEKEQLEYFFETVTFLFISGSLFLGLSLANLHLSWYYLTIALILFAIISYSDWAIFFSKNVPSRIANYIKRKLK